MRTIRTKVYKLSELSKEAQQKAIEKFYDINVDYDWWDCTYEDFKMLCETIGIDVDLKKTYFRGFAYQGQGAAFTADIDLQKLIAGINSKSYLSHAPQIEKEANFTPSPCIINKRVLALIENGTIDFSASFEAKDRPYYSKLDVSTNYTYNQCSNYNRIDNELENLEGWVKEIGEELDSLLFKLLENEYDYLTSKEAIKETIEANAYEFTKDGKQF